MATTAQAYGLIPLYDEAGQTRAKKYNILNNSGTGYGTAIFKGDLVKVGARASMVGVTTNTFRVTDAAGNSATCAFTVTVTDNIVPTITCPANISVSASVSACSEVVSYTAPTGADNCAWCCRWGF